jgi:beta-aspartyl-peptidase (threonine type)
MTTISTIPRGTAVVALLAIALLITCAGQAEEAPLTKLVIHGGAGTITRAEMTAEREAAYRAKLTEALEAGHRILAAGGAGLDSVEATIHVMEDSPLFNAGKGAVFTAAGRNELDASIMDGGSGKAGAVAGVTTVKHPISAARAVMEQTRHVLLAAGGADTFAAEIGLETVEPGYYFTERRWNALQRRREGDGLAPLPAPAAAAEPSEAGPAYGTVGALALDASGQLAAGTSTGGMTNKRYGRVGDSPIIGAGTWADKRCAVSGTGEGEYFIRLGVARDICARLDYLDLSLAEAGDQVIHGALTDAGGTGGVIALDADGNVAMPFNTEGMYRGWIGADGVAHVLIYGDED